MPLYPFFVLRYVAIVPIILPPLRDRKEDIPDLANYFLQKFNHELKKSIKGFTDEAMEILKNYYWPGNVRELQNVIERSVVLCKRDTITRKDLYLGNEPSISKTFDLEPVYSLKDAINNFKKEYIIKVLEKSGWKQTKASQLLKIQRTYLSRLINELNISKL